MVDEAKLIDLLKQGIVEIKFMSLSSGRMYNREYTTHESIASMDINQNKGNDKIICFDVDFGRWEDIDVSTIESYKTIQKL